MALTALTVAAGCSRCADAPDGGLIVAPRERPPLELSPLPAPPPLDVAVGALPGIPTGPLAAVVLRPQGELSGNERPTITFNKPVVPLGAATDAHPTPATIEPPVDGAWRWVGSTTVEFLSSAPLPYASTFVVRVNPQLKALDGQGLAAEASFTFTTLQPAVVDVQPERGWSWLDPKKPIAITFNQPVQGLDRAALTAGDARVPFHIAATVDVDDEEARRTGRRPAGRTRFGRPTRYELALDGSVPAGTDVRLALDGVRGAEGPLTVKGETLRWRTRGAMAFQAARLCTGEEQGEACPQGPLVLQASNEIDLATLKGRLHMRPAADGQAGKDIALDLDDVFLRPTWRSGGAPESWTLVVGGAFQPATAYDVIVDAGVQDDVGGGAPAFRARVKTTDVQPWLRAPTPLALLEASGDGALPIESANVTTVQAAVWPLDLPGMARFLAQDRYGSTASDPPPAGVAPFARTLDTGGARNRFVRTPLVVRDVFLPGQPRLFVAEVWADATRDTARRQRVTGQITDLAVHSKLGATQSLAWVTSLSTGKPVNGAVVTVWSERGERRFEGATDDDGLVRIPGAVDMLGKAADTDDNWSTPFAMLAATKGDDTGVTLASWEGDLAPYVSRTWDGNVPDVEVVVFTERGIYRPGEEVHLKGVVRTRSRGALQLPRTGSELRLTLSDGDGGSSVVERVRLSTFGTFHRTLRLPEKAGLGWWSIDVAGALDGRPVGGSASFRVEQYRAPQFKVDVTMPMVASAGLVSGENLRATVDARYLFGAPMPGATVEATISRSPASFEPAGHDGFVFGIHTDGWGDGEPSPSGDVFARATGTIGDDGTWVDDVGAVEATSGRTWDYTIEAEVKDVSRQAVANRASVVVHPASVYVGVRTGDGFGEAGKPMSLQVVAVDLSGKRVAGRDVEVMVSRREWKNVRRRSPYSGSFELTSEAVEVPAGGCDDVVSSMEPASCAFTAEKPGLHIVEATVTDEAGRRQRTRASFYVVGSGWVSWRRGEDDRVEIVADKASYRPGDTARLLVKSPWPQAEAVVTVEREGVKSARRVTLAGAATAVDVPLDEGDAPNVYVGVVIVRGRLADATARDDAGTAGRSADVDPGRPQVRVGMIELKVRSTAKDLSVGIAAAAGPLRPGQRVTLDLTVKDAAQRGVPAEVTLWAVDEAVLRLTSYVPPDLRQAFHPDRGLSVRLGESLIHLVRRRTWGTKGEPGGDGGDAGSGFRSNFKTTALFLPEVVTDESGHARVEVTMPDDLTTYRLMAVAVGADDRFGAGQTELVVQKPVMLLPALPRFARVGDRFEAGVVVHAARAGDVVVRASVEGGAAAPLALAGEAARTAAVAGRGVEVRFAFVAARPGRAVVRFSAEQASEQAGAGGVERDGVEVALPITLPVVMETTAVSGMTTDRREEALQPPGGSRDDVGGLEVTLASTALAGTREAMRQLVEYPHGCAEQLSSKLVPFLALRELSAGFGETHAQGSDANVAAAVTWLGPQILDDKGDAQPDRVIATTIEKLQALQDDSGGFRVWPGSGWIDPNASAWATLALSRARAVGYPVDAGRLARAQAFLRDAVLADRLPSSTWGQRRVTTDERVFAGFVLARTGQPRVAPLQQIAVDTLRTPDGLPLFVRALLVDALVVGRGDADVAQRLLQTILNAARESEREVHFEEPAAAKTADRWASDVRTSAVVMMTLAAASPEHPFLPKLARWLEGVRQKDGRYRTTQEAAWSLMAFSELVRAKEREAPAFDATVTLGGATLLQDGFRGRSLDVGLHLVPMKDVLAKTSSSPLPFVFTKKGDGTLYYSAVLRRAPTEVPTAALERGFTVQRFIEPIDDPTRHGRSAWAGDLVRVRVRVATRDARRDVAIDVPLPAGLEALDTTLASTGSLGRREDETASEGGDVEGEGAEGEEADDDAGWFWSPFSHSEKRDDRVSWYADDLPPGVHTLSFVARATTVGSFVLLPAEASEMYAPEVSGRSDGGTFAVLAPPTP